LPRPCGASPIRWSCAGSAAAPSGGRPTTLQTLLDRVAVLAKQAKVTHARKLRVDATVVETPIHYPTDSGLLGDGVRVLTRLVARAKPLLQDQLAGTRSAFRNRMRALRRNFGDATQSKRSGGRGVRVSLRTGHDTCLGLG
jgi:IS5 family transposase